MAFTISLPPLLSFIDIYPIALFDTTNKKRFKCEILEIVKNTSYNLPTQPLDSGVTIGDHVFKNPLIISIRALVSLNDIDAFNARIEDIQNKGAFFCLNDRNGNLYENLKILNINTEQNLNYSNKEIYAIDFLVIDIIEALVTKLDTSKVKNASLSNKANLGEATNKKTNASTLKNLSEALINKFNIM